MTRARYANIKIIAYIRTRTTRQYIYFMFNFQYLNRLSSFFLSFVSICPYLYVDLVSSEKVALHATHLSICFTIYVGSICGCVYFSFCHLLFGIRHKPIFNVNELFVLTAVIYSISGT